MIIRSSSSHQPRESAVQTDMDRLDMLLENMTPGAREETYEVISRLQGCNTHVRKHVRKLIESSVAGKDMVSLQDLMDFAALNSEGDSRSLTTWWEYQVIGSLDTKLTFYDVETGRLWDEDSDPLTLNPVDWMVSVEALKAVVDTLPSDLLRRWVKSFS